MHGAMKYIAYNLASIFLRRLQKQLKIKIKFVLKSVGGKAIKF